MHSINGHAKHLTYLLDVGLVLEPSALTFAVLLEPACDTEVATDVDCVGATFGPLWFKAKALAIVAKACTRLAVGLPAAMFLMQIHVPTLRFSAHPRVDTFI